MFDGRAVARREMLELPHRVAPAPLRAAGPSRVRNVREHRDRRQSREPLPVLLDLVARSPTRPSGSSSRRRSRFVVDDRAQIVEIVEKDVARACRRAGSTSRGNAMSRMQSGRSPRSRQLPARPVRRSTIGCGAAVEQSKHVDIGEARPALVVVERLAPWRSASATARSYVRFATIAVRTPSLHEALERELRHLAGAEDHRAPAAERAEDLLRELHGRRAHRRCAAANAPSRLRTRPPRAATIWNSRLSTARDALRLASHASRTCPWICASPRIIESSPDATRKRCADRLAIASHVADTPPRLRRAARRRSLQIAGAAIRVAFDDVDLGAIARREQHELARAPVARARCVEARGVSCGATATCSRTSSGAV